jgi:hypothetical protein
LRVLVLLPNNFCKLGELLYKRMSLARKNCGRDILFSAFTEVAKATLSEVKSAVEVMWSTSPIFFMEPEGVSADEGCESNHDWLGWRWKTAYIEGIGQKLLLWIFFRT